MPNETFIQENKFHLSIVGDFKAYFQAQAEKCLWQKSRP